MSKRVVAGTKSFSNAELANMQKDGLENKLKVELPWHLQVIRREKEKRNVDSKS